jgi:hypothetical protein
MRTRNYGQVRAAAIVLVATLLIVVACGGLTIGAPAQVEARLRALETAHSTSLAWQVRTSASLSAVEGHLSRMERTLRDLVDLLSAPADEWTGAR